MTLARRKAIFARDTQYAIEEYPVVLRWLGQTANGSLNGGRLSIDAIDGAILDNQTATIHVMKAALVLPLPVTGKVIEIRNADDVTFRSYEVETTLGENDPNEHALTLIVGPVGKRQ